LTIAEKIQSNNSPYRVLKEAALSTPDQAAKQQLKDAKAKQQAIDKYLASKVRASPRTPRPKSESRLQNGVVTDGFWARPTLSTDAVIAQVRPFVLVFTRYL
jgi:hypothetical protein